VHHVDVLAERRRSECSLDSARLLLAGQSSRHRADLHHYSHSAAAQESAKRRFDRHQTAETATGNRGGNGDTAP